MEDRNTDIRMLEINVKETIRKLEIFQTDGRNGKIKNYNANYGEYVITVLEYLNSVVNILNSCSETTITRINSVIRKANKIMDKFYNFEKQNSSDSKKDSLSDNDEKYYIINVQDHDILVTKVDEDDEVTTETERKRINSVYIEDYIPAGFLFLGKEYTLQEHIYLYAVEDEKGLREVITGIPLMKWKEEKYLSPHYYYYESLTPVSKENVANGLASILQKKEWENLYRKEIGKLEGEYFNKYREKGYENERELEKEKLDKETKKQRTLKNMQKLDSFRTNNK